MALKSLLRTFDFPGTFPVNRSSYCVASYGSFICLKAKAAEVIPKSQCRICQSVYLDSSFFNLKALQSNFIYGTYKTRIKKF